MTSKSGFTRSREALLQALKEANQTFGDFYDDASAVAPFPSHWLKLESRCLDRVESTKQAAQTFLRWKADLGEVMEALQPQQAAPPSKRNSTESLEEAERLRKQIKTLQQDLKTAKAVQGRPFPHVTCMSSLTPVSATSSPSSLHTALCFT